jgi:hypothetical protein
MSRRSHLSRKKRMPIIHGILAFIVVIVVLQLWLLTTTMNAYLGGDTQIVAPAAYGSLVCLALNVGLLRHLDRLA